jgi:hypothetical protein
MGCEFMKFYFKQMPYQAGGYGVEYQTAPRGEDGEY